MVCYFLEVQVRNRVRGSPPGPTELPARMNGTEVHVCPEFYIQAVFLASPPKNTHTSPSTSLLLWVLCSMPGSPSSSSSTTTHPQR